MLVLCNLPSTPQGDVSSSTCHRYYCVPAPMKDKKLGQTRDVFWLLGTIGGDDHSTQKGRALQALSLSSKIHSL